MVGFQIHVEQQCFSLLKNQKKNFFTKFCHNHINNGNTRDCNVDGSDNENSKFEAKKWYVIDSKSKGNYSKDDPITFLTKSLKSSLCNYSVAF